MLLLSPEKFNMARLNHLLIRHAKTVLLCILLSIISLRRYILHVKLKLSVCVKTIFSSLNQLFTITEQRNKKYEFSNKPAKTVIETCPNSNNCQSFLIIGEADIFCDLAPFTTFSRKTMCLFSLEKCINISAMFGLKTQFSMSKYSLWYLSIKRAKCALSRGVAVIFPLLQFDKKHYGI